MISRTVKTVAGERINARAISERIVRGRAEAFDQFRRLVGAVPEQGS
jgi:hypothetical protein